MTVIFYFLCILVMSINEAVAQAAISEAESLETAGQIYDFPFRNRSTWGARTPKGLLPLNTPVPYVVIHESAEPPSVEVTGCFNFTQCSQSMKNIQNLHMDDNGWWDIGYQFAVGSDGAAYEGRGWNVLGAHAKYFNTVSIGICLIGGFESKLPSLGQLNTVNELIAAGVKMGYIRPDYRLVTHGQLRNMPCPGKKLMKKVRTWPHYSNFPETVKDLLDIPEIPDSVKEEIKTEIGGASDAV